MSSLQTRTPGTPGRRRQPLRCPVPLAALVLWGRPFFRPGKTGGLCFLCFPAAGGVWRRGRGRGPPPPRSHALGSVHLEHTSERPSSLAAGGRGAPARARGCHGNARPNPAKAPAQGPARVRRPRSPRCTLGTRRRREGLWAPQWQLPPNSARRPGKPPGSAPPGHQVVRRAPHRRHRRRPHSPGSAPHSRSPARGCGTRGNSDACGCHPRSRAHRGTLCPLPPSRCSQRAPKSRAPDPAPSAGTFFLYGAVS
jgi:hypothetical protein